MKHTVLRCAVWLIPVVVLAFGLSPQATPASAQNAPFDPQVESILLQMSPEERVGQLFLVTYYGSDIGPDSDIARLVTQYHVGGVMLSFENDNFTDSPAVSEQVYDIVSQLQTLAADRTPVPVTLEPPPSAHRGPYVPLFIGIEQDAGGLSLPSVYSEITGLPSDMALGATWDPALAEASGQVAGQDLSSLGINLLIGPSADVVEIPQPLTSGDLGTSVFGGEPFWVSRMTSAYVRGIHEGSLGRIAVVPEHFPGHGAADRVASVEVPTIRLSLDQLKQFDLIPFFAVTGDAADSSSTADALLTGHISYRGFQGDTHAQTRPISLDQQALQALVKLEKISKWRADGGLLITDALGQAGIRRLYDPQDASFPNKRIAQDALLAGNDVLYVAQFGSDPRSNQTETIANTIDFFVQTYEKDPAFQARVDDAVRRIIHKKLSLYTNFNLEATVLPLRAGIAQSEGQSNVPYKVAQGAVTLLSPGRPDLLTPPQSGDRIVIFTDTREVRYCSKCDSHPAIPVSALQSAITRLYGPQGSAVGWASVQSYSFDLLANYLQVGPQIISGENATATPDSLTQALNSANWVIFVMQDIDPAVSSSDVVKRFLAVSRISPRTQIVVMAMRAPYYLDSTEIGKLTAYYGLYDSSSPFIDVAARALFVGVPFNGASPVTVTGISYNILEATLPSPDQIIKLSVHPDTPASAQPTTTTAVPASKLGDKVIISTGVIVDKNGHPVPDGTPVDFLLNYATEGVKDTLTSTTVGGVASTPLVLTRPGELQITSQTNLAHQSLTLVMSIPGTGSITITVVPPNVSPTPTLTPTERPLVTPTPSPLPPSPKRVSFRDLMITMFGLFVIGMGAFAFGRLRGGVNFGLLLALPSVITGLIGYNYYALLLPGSLAWRDVMSEFWGAATASWAMALVGLAAIGGLIYGGQRWSLPPLTRRDRRQNHSGYKGEK